MWLSADKHVKHFKDYRQGGEERCTMQVRKYASKEIKLSRFIFFYFCLVFVFTPLGSLAIVCVHNNTYHTFSSSTGWI